MGLDENEYIMTGFFSKIHLISLKLNTVLFLGNALFFFSHGLNTLTRPLYSRIDTKIHAGLFCRAQKRSCAVCERRPAENRRTAGAPLKQSHFHVLFERL